MQYTELKQQFVQVKKPEEFLIGKTVVATGKTKWYDATYISFIFSDKTFVLYRVNIDGLKFTSDDILDQCIFSHKALFELKLISAQQLEVYLLEEEIKNTTYYIKQHEEYVLHNEARKSKLEELKTKHAQLINETKI